MNIPEDVRWIIGQLNQQGYEACAVGGCVRDMLLDREPEDWEELADPEDGQWRLLTDWKLYQDSRLDAEIIQGKKQQKLYPLKVTWKETEGNWQECWILVELENGAQGWIYAEWTDEKWILNREKDAREVIEGYSSAG